MKRAFKVKQKAFSIIFKGLSVIKSRLRPYSAPLRKQCFLCSSCLLLITESINLVNQLSIIKNKTNSGITSICLTIWEEIDDTSSFIALKTTSGCIISEEMFFNNSIKITVKWCINNFFFETIFLFLFLRLFSLLTSFLSLFLSLSLSLSLSWVLNLLAAFILFQSF